MKADSFGTLYLVSTPIGNLGDITLRALEVLKSADIIAAEDTRHSRILTEKYEIKTPMTSYHEHNKFEKAEVLVGRLKSGENVALVTDAGTPSISDPGEVLVKRCREEGIPVTAAPGVSALVTALSISGMSARRFCFEGFLPADKAEREKVLEDLAAEERTIILYEAPHHLKKTLEKLLERLGDRRICVCRELTKAFEEAESMTLSEAEEYYTENDPRGEFVLIIEGRSRREAEEEKRQKWRKMTAAEHLEYYTSQGIEKKEAMKRMAADLGCSKRDVYSLLLEE